MKDFHTIQCNPVCCSWDAVCYTCSFFKSVCVYVRDCAYLRKLCVIHEKKIVFVKHLDNEKIVLRNIYRCQLSQLFFVAKIRTYNLCKRKEIAQFFFPPISISMFSWHVDILLLVILTRKII